MADFAGTFHGLDELVDLIAAKGKNVVFVTGGGLSSASGLPPFREIGTGNKSFSTYGENWWTVKKFEENPLVWWNEFWQKLYSKEGLPNSGHKALSHISRNYPDIKIVTQSVDGLHGVSGVEQDKLAEIYGRIGQFRCTENPQHVFKRSELNLTQQGKTTEVKDDNEKATVEASSESKDGGDQQKLKDSEEKKTDAESNEINTSVTEENKLEGENESNEEDQDPRENHFKTVPCCPKCGCKVLPSVKLAGEKDGEFSMEEGESKEDSVKNAASWLKAADGIVFVGSSVTGINSTILQWISSLDEKNIPKLYIIGTRPIENAIHRAGLAEKFAKLKLFNSIFNHLQGRPEQALAVVASTVDHIHRIESDLEANKEEFDVFATVDDSQNRENCQRRANSKQPEYSWMGGSSSSDFYDSSEEKVIALEMRRRKVERLKQHASHLGLTGTDADSFWQRNSPSVRKRAPKGIRQGRSNMILVIARSMLPGEVNNEIGLSSVAPEWAKKRKSRSRSDSGKKQRNSKRKRGAKKQPDRKRKGRKRRKRSSDKSNAGEDMAADILASMFA